jgi:hypothetical protein
MQYVVCVAHVERETERDAGVKAPATLRKQHDPQQRVVFMQAPNTGKSLSLDVKTPLRSRAEQLKCLSLHRIVGMHGYSKDWLNVGPRQSLGSLRHGPQPATVPTALEWWRKNRGTIFG